MISKISSLVLGNKLYVIKVIVCIISKSFDRHNNHSFVVQFFLISENSEFVLILMEVKSNQRIVLLFLTKLSLKLSSCQVHQ